MSEHAPMPSAGEQLGPISVEVSGERVRAYADASGDHNPIHLDAAFAATTVYGGTIAHGMLLLAYISRLLTARFGAAWVENGSLDARFRGPAMVGSTVTVAGEITAVDAVDGATDVQCAVRVLDVDGQALVTATAKLRLAG